MVEAFTVKGMGDAIKDTAPWLSASERREHCASLNHLVLELPEPADLAALQAVRLAVVDAPGGRAARRESGTRSKAASRTRRSRVRHLAGASRPLRARRLRRGGRVRPPAGSFSGHTHRAKLHVLEARSPLAAAAAS